jgi:hypothetical protein
MKKTAKISGIISTMMVVFGIFLKINHWPGGSILVILGVGTFSAISLTSLMFYKRKAATTQLEKVEAGLSWFAGSILAVGLLFAVQHWPGSGSNLLMGIFLSIIFLVVHFINVSKYTNERKKFGIFEILVVVMFAALFLGGNLAAQGTADIKKQIGEYNQLRVAISEQLEQNELLFGSIVNNYLKDTADNNVYSSAMLVHEKTNKMVDYIINIRGKLVALSAGLADNHIGDTLRVELLSHPNDFDTPTHFMIGSDPENITGESKPLYDSIFRYYDAIEAILPESSKKQFREFTKPLLPFHTTITDKNGSMTSVSWMIGTFYHKAIIETLTALQQVESNILSAESEAFKQIQNRSSK